MIQVVGIRFPDNPTIYYATAGEIFPSVSDDVIVDRAGRLAYATVVIAPHPQGSPHSGAGSEELPTAHNKGESKGKHCPGSAEGNAKFSRSGAARPSRSPRDAKGGKAQKDSEIKLVRIATPQDIEKRFDNLQKENDALELCKEKVLKHKLPMKLIKAEYAFDRSKLLFYFTADGRVDFRLLVKDLASLFRTRIELRQVGVRDEAKMLGGIGVCGQPFCCKSFLNDFQPVSIKMAKEQGLSLSPTKISGTCGRLMCCLQYEQDTYEELMRITPRLGNVVKTPEGVGRVTDRDLLGGTLCVVLDDKIEAGAKKFPVAEVALMKKKAMVKKPIPQKKEEAPDT